MTKLIIQIPCLNEEETLPDLLKEIPESIEGVDLIEVLIMDDGSTDRTSEVARENGVNHIIRNTVNLGLARTFRRGLDYAMGAGADIVVNMDGDHQYKATDIPKLIQPILEKKADIVIGNRQTDTIPEFSPLKKFLQWFGSSVVRHLSKTKVIDATSGFRAFNRYAAQRLTVLSYYTYTLETILQTRHKGLAVTNIPITTNPSTRKSRLMTNIRSYITFSITTMIRVFTMYNPLRVFIYLGVLFLSPGFFLGLRFLYFVSLGEGSGHIQSLILSAILIITGVTIILSGLIADIIQFNRRLLEDLLERVKRIEYNKSSKNKSSL